MPERGRSRRDIRVVAPVAVLFLCLQVACMGILWPPTIHALTAGSDSCGNLTVDIDAEASGRQLELLVDGQSVERFRIDGREVVHRVVSGSPGGAHHVVARFSDRVEEHATVPMKAVEDAVTLANSPERIYQGQAGFLEVSVSDICADGIAPAWELQVDGMDADRGTMLPASKSARHTVSSALPVGRHVATSRVQLSGQVTEVDALTFFVEPPCTDADGDGIRTCDGDCDDADDRVGTCEESTDRDGDGYPSLASGGTDCNDANSGVHPGAVDAIDADEDGFVVRDGLDQDCDGIVDNGAVEVDCDDTNRLVNPGRSEASTPNGIDDNCDGRVDEGTRAYDDDGDGLSENDGDCDDADPDVSPEARERPNCRDDDCDGDIDEGVDPIVMEDTYEANDERDAAHDLGGRGRNRFSKTLQLNSRDTSDEEWFVFYSSDGAFDSWGITAKMTRGPQRSRYEFSVFDASGSLRSRSTVSSDGQGVNVTGKGLRPDSGDYYLRVRPLALPHDYCPVTVQLTSR